ncbi:folylpolyglutamate synthase/dihydrofolate synthase family protein [Ruminococcus flavefaciens]|uniref:bifunctional folylpolyglutamate synthase/dihydrofolate synthase n=1 Tax=Ruminococcus flavefaciens TaxID=1265 RepID=UPI0026EEA0D3|nr:folylpolyglutamate synthase/dihydrofolate synthase family protein [Ruminococcus flavefaciens]
MNYTDAIEYMKIAAQRGSVLGLSRITELLGLMGDPQDKIKTVHIAGTNGKGSFGAMLTSVLKCAGYRVGGFSSPAITDITDSFRIGGEVISEQDFADLIGYIAPICESMDEKPTEFEVLTAAAFELFVRKKCDIAVVECGMGGDTDSTNVIKAPVLSVVTNVQKDHGAFLGNNIAEIAAHKCGIFKAGRPAYFGGNSEEAYEIAADTANRLGCELFIPDYAHFSWSDDNCTINGTDLIYKGQKLHIPLLGTYQFENAVNVLSCIEILRREGIDIPESAVRQGLEKVKWHGRFEVISKEPLIIYDGAHNPDGIRCAADSIRRYFGDKKVVLLIGVMADKEYGLYADMLGELADTAFAVKPDNPRALNSSALAQALTQRGLETRPFDDFDSGVKTACEYAEQRRMPLIALGSLYMYRQFMASIKDVIH